MAIGGRTISAVCIGRSSMFAAMLLLPAIALANGQTVASVTLTGTVEDQTGAVLPGAAVDLVGASGTILQSTRTDASGAFRFDSMVPGQYELRAAFDGFKPGAVRVRVAGRGPMAQKLVLALADVQQDITVGNETAQVDTTGSSNQDGVAIDSNMLASLPIFDQDFVGALSRFLDAGSIGTNGVTVVVNGMEVNALNVSASAVQQIKINQDPYSAESSRPGRGRIEILTKPGSQQYHGEVNVLFRDAQFNARNAFASSQPAERRRIVEGSLGGPVGHSRKSSFMLSAVDNAEDQQVPVFALGPSGTIRDSVPLSNRRTLVSLSLTRQEGDKNTISIMPSYNYESNRNRGAGGVTLASAATTFQHREEQVTYTQQTMVRPSLVNQLQFLVGHEREPTTNASEAVGIVVAGAFTGGGAQSDVLRTERHIQLTESLAWSGGRHLVQTGFQLPDWSRRGFYDRSNVGGTFYFSNLDAYASGRPYAFIQQQGDGAIAFLEKQVGLYVKDDWQVRPGLSASFGLRYDWQNYFHDNNNLAPRFSLAYAPGNRKIDVIRVGAGVFNDRSGPVVIADLLHYQTGRLVRYVLTDPSYPDPFQSTGSPASQPPSIVQLAPKIQIPWTLQYSIGLDHQLRKTATLSMTYTGALGYHMFLSRDVNAPLPPLYFARPDTAYGAVRQIESDGRQRTDSVQLSLRGTVTRWFNGQMQYTWSRAYNDTNGIAWYPANDYDNAGEWARADFDRPHRFLVLGRVSPTPLFDLGVGLSLYSGSPYTETFGQDMYNNGRGRARPAGLPRNSLQGTGYADLDLRVSRDVRLRTGAPQARTLTFALDAFNMLNRVNYTNFVGTVSSPLFGQPVGAREPRQLQCSARVRF